MIAVGFFSRRRAFGPTHPKPGNHECRDVRQIVESIADQRDGMAGVTGGQLDCHQDERGNNCCAQDARHAFQRQMYVRMPARAMALAMVVTVPRLSV